MALIAGLLVLMALAGYASTFVVSPYRIFHPRVRGRLADLARYNDPDELTKDHDLDSLRGDAEFERLVEAARRKAVPGAPIPH